MIIDVNVNLSHWPFRRLPLAETSRLVAKLQRSGITQAWAGSFDGLLHADIAAVNSRLVAECRSRGDGMLLPVGTVNPTLPDWQDDVRRCHEDHGMQIIRLHPNYHGYKLDDPVCEEVFAAAADRHLILQLALKMEDIRTHHPLLMVPTVDTAPLAGLLDRHPQLPVIILNDLPRGAALAALLAADNLFFDISHAEQVGALEKLIKDVPYERLLFGSHAPFFNLEATLLKFKESELGNTITAAIQSGNAAALLAN